MGVSNGVGGGLPAQPAEWPAGPNNGGGVTLIDPTNNGLLSLAQPYVANDRFGNTVGRGGVYAGLVAGDTIATARGVGVMDSTTFNLVAALDYDTSVFASGGAVKWADPNGVHKGAIYVGTGVPIAAGGANGDIAIRTDTPGTVNQRIYVRSGGAWVGIL